MPSNRVDIVVVATEQGQVYCGFLNMFSKEGKNERQLFDAIYLGFYGLEAPKYAAQAIHGIYSEPKHYEPPDFVVMPSIRIFNIETILNCTPKGVELWNGIIEERKIK